jgi:hypothetical protein
MARLSLLTAGFLLSWTAALPALAEPDCKSGAFSAPCLAALSGDQGMIPSQVATRGPTPLQEPHAVDDAAAAKPHKAMPAKHITSSPHRPTVGTSKIAPAQLQRVAKPKPRPAPPQIAAKPLAKPASPQATAKTKPKSSNLAQSQMRHPRFLAGAPHRARPAREARRSFEYPEERPHSGPVYGTTPGPAPLVPGCDEACQYRDWLNRYAAWYRDFGRYYYGPTAPLRPAPPPQASRPENRPAPVLPVQSYRFDRSERDRLDPWHGYNSHTPDNGY